MEKKKSSKPAVLIYAHYYYPDVASTGQILQDLAEGMSDSFDIIVICTVPSYTGKVSPVYKTSKYYFEEHKGIRIVRVRVPEYSKESKVSRIKNILAYFFNAMRATGKVGDIDYVYTISQPPILGGLLGVWGKCRKRAKLIYNIQDFNPEQIIATGYSKNKVGLKLMIWIDKFSCKMSNKVIVVGRDMVDTLNKRFNNDRVPAHVHINNWIDEKEIYPMDHTEQGVARFREQFGLTGKYVVMYSGNLGLYYDLENLLHALYGLTGIEETKSLVTPDGREVVFAFVGDGCMRNRMIKYVEEKKMSNVIFIPYQSKDELQYSLNAADLHWCISALGIKGVSVPSKIYGIMSCGKPIIGMMEKGSEARLIMEEVGCGLVCEPGDYESVIRNLKWFVEHAESSKVKNMGVNGSTFLRKELTKDMSINKYISEIRSC